MSGDSIPIHLTVSEYRLIKAFRDMPESPLKDRLAKLLDDLAAFARNPRCAELQADGAPCANPETDCDQCHIVLELLDSLDRRLPR